MRAVQRLKPLAWAVAWSSSLVLALLALALPEPPHRLEYRQLANQRGMPLRVLVFLPEPAASARKIHELATQQRWCSRS